jgi:hypothetical protein
MAPEGDVPRSMVLAACAPARADVAVPGPLFAAEGDADLPPPGPPPPDLLPWLAGALALAALGATVAARLVRARAG